MIYILGPQLPQLPRLPLFHMPQNQSPKMASEILKVHLSLEEAEKILDR